MSQFECNNWIALEHPEINHGYKSGIEAKYHGFTNYSTFKVVQYIFGYEEFQAYVRECDKMDQNKPYDKTIVESGLTDSITNVLGGVHFNSGRELKEYMLKYMPLESLKPSEYSYVNWNEIWAQMGHENEFGLASDIGLTGSYYEQLVKENPEYGDVVSKINSEEPVITPEERMKLKIENSKIILHNFITRLWELKGNPNLKKPYDEIAANIKRVIVDLYNTCRCFPTTGDPIVDSYLGRCSVK